MKIKICGITRLEDALLVENMGAWALGYIFYPKSPRYIEPAKVKAINTKLGRINKVGVFVNASITEIITIAEKAGINYLQLHGEENPDFCQILKDKNYQIIKAFRLKSETEITLINKYSMVDHILVDAFHQQEYGGTGKVADWDLVNQIADKSNLILAGGLKPDNILKAAENVKPFAFDLSSGVEVQPGIKEHEQITKLFAVIKGK